MIKDFNSYINESLKDKIKGKSNDDILNSIKDMIPEHKFINACKHHLTWLVKHLIKENLDPSFNDNMCLINSGILEYNDIVDILMKNEKVISQLYKTQLSNALSKIDDDDRGYYDDDDNWIEYDDDDKVDWHYGEDEDEDEGEWEEEEI